MKSTQIPTQKRTQKHTKIAQAIFLATAVFSSNAFAVDLIGVYRDALAQDPAFASARFENVAAQERLPQAQAANKWSAGLAAGINFADSQRSGLSTPSSTTPSYSLSLRQPLYNPVADRNPSLALNPPTPSWPMRDKI